MLTEAFPVAAAGAIYPIAFVAIVGLLGSSDPLRRSVAFFAGGALASMLGYIVIVTVLQSVQLTPRDHPTGSALLEIALGVALFALAVRTVVRHRKPGGDAPARKESEADKSASDTEGRSLRRTFIAGILVYFPGVFLIASAKTIADAHASLVSTYATAVVCVILLLAIVEIPIIAFAVSPGRVKPVLDNTIGWAQRHSYTLLVTIEVLGGIYLLATGIDALATS